MVERELKYSSPSDNIPTFNELEPILSPYKLSPAKIQQIYDRYYDDALASLEKSGIGLRKRVINNKRLVTLKISNKNEAGLFEREEIELEQKSSGWPTPIYTKILDYCDPAMLRKIIEFKTRRVSFGVVKNREIAIISFDKVTAKQAQKNETVEFFEVEIEAVGQTTFKELKEIASRLGKVIEMSKNTTNKLVRAKALLGLGLKS